VSLDFVPITETDVWLSCDPNILTPAQKVITNNLAVIANEMDELKKLIITTAK